MISSYFHCSDSEKQEEFSTESEGCKCSDKEDWNFTPAIALARAEPLRDEFLGTLSPAPKGRVKLFDETRSHSTHGSLASVGGKGMLVVDPRWARKSVATDSARGGQNAWNEFLSLLSGSDLKPQTQQHFDSVAN